MTVQNSPQVAKHQKRVRSVGKCLKILGTLIVIGSVLNIAGNVIFLLVPDMFSQIPWVDSDGTLNYFYIDTEGLCYLAVAKIMCCFLYYKQGKATLNVIKPLLKAAESDVQITERKSKETKHLIKKVKKITIAIFVLCLVTISYGKDYMLQEGSRFLDQWYDKHENQPQIQYNQTALFREIPEFPYDDQEDAKKADQDIIPTTDEEPSMKHHYSGKNHHGHQNRHHHDDHHMDQDSEWQHYDYRNPMQEVTDWLESRTRDEAQQDLKMFLSGCIMLGAFQGFFMFFFFQAVYIYGIKKVMKAQKKLELIYLGPELVIPQGTIQYIAVSPETIGTLSNQNNQMM